LKSWHFAVFTTALILMRMASLSSLWAKSYAPGTLQGSVVDPKEQAVAGASVTVQAEGNSGARKVVRNGEGRFTLSGLGDGKYSVVIAAPGFASVARHGVRVGADASPALSITLTLASVSEEVTVNAEDNTSVAAQLSPVKAHLDAGSARAEITNSYIREFTSPVVDFTEVMQIAPGTVSVSPNGVGLGQTNTSFRGFIDGDYTVTYDGIPFEDTNTPSHHSWPFFPGPTIGGVDFDRSPGTASDIGPANYGGSIHFLSPQLPTDQLYRMSESYGSFNTNLIDGEYNTGLFGGANPKANLWFDGHPMRSDGYETFNFQDRTASAAKFTYKFSDKTYLTLDGNAGILDSNTPNNNPTRAQIAEHGNNYLLDGSEFYSDGSSVDSQRYEFYFYHVPTKFEYADLNKDLGNGWKLDTKAYTHGYSNHQHYNNKTANSTLDDPTTGLPLPTVTATSAIDKMNQYEKAGEILSVSSASKYGVFRTGLWYEYAGATAIRSSPIL